MSAGVLSLGPGPQDLARQILEHQAPQYRFAFSPFLLQTYRHGVAPDRPLCKAWQQGHCPLGNACPDRHVASNPSNFNNLVCKHWLRGLCKKGEGCEFLHEYNLRKMPECNFFAKNGFCSNGDECLYLHLDPSSKLPPCPHYNKGFCPLGPICAQRHIRREICVFYLAGFCPDGPKCKNAHPKWPKDLPKPTVKVEKDPDELMAEQLAAAERAQQREEEEREKYGGGGDRDDGGRDRGGRGRGRWHGGGYGGGRNRGGGGGGRRGRGGYH
ncbi:related to mRNA 3'-end-processing protein YTH1 [Phialocephala subalpina]|uniref:mRNA 3'-end-processing protein n=1 Tax=Phialocephala subalpina TaxID=576137 RepID=A0A1L7WRE6_9HELO|nr:related to mRNA 3'-end-processing protein YTH1 [Phialocephala subalpina]